MISYYRHFQKPCVFVRVFFHILCSCAVYLGHVYTFVTNISVCCAVLCCSCPLCCRRLLCCQSQHRPSVTWLEPGNYLAWRLLPFSYKPCRALLMPKCINDFGHSAPDGEREAECHSCIFRLTLGSFSF